VTVLVARTLGPHDFGRFQFALALTLLLSFVVMLGLPKLLVRELARDPDGAVTRIDSALFICLVAGGVVVGPLLGIGWLAGADMSLFLMAGLTMIADSMARIVCRSSGPSSGAIRGRSRRFRNRRSWPSRSWSSPPMAAWRA
jgi:O-antigen/teichoic acid export membrane protein